MSVAALTGFEGQDVRTLIDARVRERGDHPFMIWEPFDGEPASWSYAQFGEAVRRVAAGLAARRAGPGDRVLIPLTYRPDFVIAWLSCRYAGLVAVTTNTGSAPDEIAYFVEHSRAVGAVTQADHADAVRAALAPGAWMIVVDAVGGHHEPFTALAGRPDEIAPRSPDPAAPFGIQYTSGTTARPKAVLWSHANALWGASMSAMHEALTPADVHLVHLPLFHTNAQVYSVLASLWAGSTIVLQPRFSASRFWPISLRHRCTWTSVVPFCIRAMLTQPTPAEHWYRNFGNPVCDHPADAALRVKSVGWWGMTETITHGTVGSPHHPDRPLSIGRPSPGYDILVLDEAGEPVGPGETGDLHVRGRRGVSLFVEYVDDPHATAAAFTDDGLFITGDRVRVDADGYLFFVERAKDMLKVGGENIAASEIERVVSAVAGVSEVAVVGRPHAMLDEVPVAFVIPTASSADDLPGRIADACAASLAAFKQPAEIRIVSEFPRSTLNKVAKAALRAVLAEELEKP